MTDREDELCETTSTDVDIEYHPSWRTEKIYICPRGIPSHRGKSWACGRQCRSAQGDAEVEYEDVDVLKVLEVRKRIVFNQGVCVVEQQEEE